jgi:hypothetical protein
MLIAGKLVTFAWLLGISSPRCQQTEKGSARLGLKLELARLDPAFSPSRVESSSKLYFIEPSRAEGFAQAAHVLVKLNSACWQR